jgi:hypothetical protein
MSLFEGLAGAHGTHGVPVYEKDKNKWGIKSTAKSIRKPVTVELWDEHLEGKRPLGVIPIREDNTCGWGSIDFDEYDVDLLELIVRVEAAKLPLVPCRSKSGGLHLFLFLKRPEAAADVQAALRDAAASLGMAECEIFPKQSRVLSDRNDMGNWMVMPYYGGTFDGKLKLQHGLKRTGAEMTIGEFVAYAEGRRTTIAEFTALCERRREPTHRKKDGGGKKSRADFSDGPPCLQHLAAAGFQKDGRKRSLFMFALYYKRSAPDSWKERLEEANQRLFSPALPAAEVHSVINSVEKKDYEYTCKEEPMKSHCDSGLCRTRRFGVGRGGEYPIINGMSKLLSEPPIWFVDVEGERLELSTEELQLYPKFHKACMDRVGKCFKMVRMDAWLSIVSEAMENMVVIEAPPDVSVGGRFHELLEEFLTNRARGTRKEDLLSGRPWEDQDDKRHYFTLRSLQRYLGQEGMRELTRGQITRKIETLSGGHHFFNFKNQHGISCWWVPSSSVRQMPEIDQPKIQGEEV